MRPIDDLLPLVRRDVHVVAGREVGSQPVGLDGVHDDPPVLGAELHVPRVQVALLVPRHARRIEHKVAEWPQRVEAAEAAQPTQQQQLPQGKRLGEAGAPRAARPRAGHGRGSGVAPGVPTLGARREPAAQSSTFLIPAAAGIGTFCKLGGRARVALGGVGGSGSGRRIGGAATDARERRGGGTRALHTFS
eukprot:scaffold1756_cov117-Isochrysis_galbana.AAC.5